MIVVPDLGELFLLDVLLKGSATGSFFIHLYKNDYTPNRESELADFTEADFGSYAAVELLRSVWLDAVTVGGVGVSTYGIDWIAWLSDAGSQTVYGYYVTDDTDAVVLWAERFGSPMTVTDANPAMVLPTMRLHSESQPAPP